MNAELSDVTLVVAGTKIPAHKVILSASSSYFRALFSDGFAESSQNEITLQVPLEAFKWILKYIYTGRISLAALNGDQIIDLCNLANLYGFGTVKAAISAYLKRNISVDNCISMLVSADFYSLEELSEVCLKFIDRNAIELMNHDTFNALTQDSLHTLVKRDTFYAPEIDIFKAVKIWLENNPNSDVKVSSNSNLCQ